MDIVVIAIVSFATSLLTLFSGFGLGTLLMPVVAIFFNVEIAIAITAIVHFANNLFKFSLFYRHVSWRVFSQFGLTALCFALLGAWLLQFLSYYHQVIEYRIAAYQGQTSALNLLIAAVIVIFVIIEKKQLLQHIQLNHQYLRLGGAISGFFGGLSGHQGALRSWFLLKTKLPKQSYIATGVAIALVVDAARITIYTKQFYLIWQQQAWFISVTAVSAFLGAYFGKKWLTKIKIQWINQLVSALLIAIAIALALGII